MKIEKYGDTAIIALTLFKRKRLFNAPVSWLWRREPCFSCKKPVKVEDVRLLTDLIRTLPEQEKSN